MNLASPQKKRSDDRELREGKEKERDDHRCRRYSEKVGFYMLFLCELQSETSLLGCMLVLEEELSSYYSGALVSGGFSVVIFSLES